MWAPVRRNVGRCTVLQAPPANKPLAPLSLLPPLQSLALVLGTSLQIAPSNELPLITREAGGKVTVATLEHKHFAEGRGNTFLFFVGSAVVAPPSSPASAPSISLLLPPPHCSLISPLPTKVAIVNLQKTPRDRQAHLLVRARVDFCMALLMRGLGLAVPKVRLDVSGEDGASMHWGAAGCQIRICASSHFPSSFFSCCF